MGVLKELDGGHKGAWKGFFGGGESPREKVQKDQQTGAHPVRPRLANDVPTSRKKKSVSKKISHQGIEHHGELPDWPEGGGCLCRKGGKKPLASGKGDRLFGVGGVGKVPLRGGCPSPWVESLSSACQGASLKNEEAGPSFLRPPPQSSRCQRKKGSAKNYSGQKGRGSRKSADPVAGGDAKPASKKHFRPQLTRETGVLECDR